MKYIVLYVMKHKAYKFRLTPNKTQSTLINKTIGCVRLIYNCMLYERQQLYKTTKDKEDKPKYKTEKQYKLDHEFLKEVDSIALQQSRIDLCNAYKNFFTKLKRKQKTSLKYKSKRNPKNSYRTINVNNSIRVEENKIKLPKLGWINFKKSREVVGNIKSVTITKNILNRYYISVLCETDIEYKPEVDKEIGIDLGLKDFLIDSDGNQIENPRYLRKLEHKLAKAQRKFSKRKKNSNRKFKQQQRVFRIHEKISNMRNDFLHKLSSELINENQVICLENLSVSGMVKNHKLAKSISDVSWSKFVELLKYKAIWYGREISQINRFFPSSKLCSECGWKKKDLRLSDRSWICGGCGIEHDRDINAAQNILREGIRIMNGRDCRDSSLNIQALVCSS